MTLTDMELTLQVNIISGAFIDQNSMHAGTIMSKTYGVAKKANAIAVKAFDKNGDGTEKYVSS